jgi:dipeptidyl aminopeptidase/acylaminoacyl peptidase
MRTPPVMLLATFVLPLALLAGCDGPVEPDLTPGTLEFRVTTSGVDHDRSGYAVEINGQPVGRVFAQGSFTLKLPPASYEVRLAGLQSNCAVQGGPVSVQIAAGAHHSAAMAVTCTALPSLSGRIVWLRNWEIWQAMPDMTGAELMLPNPGILRWGMTISPDRKWVAYTQSLPGSAPTNVMVSTFNGDEPFAVAASTALDQTPAWTADGRLLFISNRRGEGNDLWVTGFDGAPPVRIADNVHHPVVSPDGARVAFASTREGAFDVYVMNLDGSGVLRLTSNDFYEAEPSWSPDGSRIAFIAQAGAPSYSVHVMDADGGNRHQVTSPGGRFPNNSGWDGVPTWSPDGTRIIFQTRIQPGWWDLFVVDVDGGNETRLTDTPMVPNQNAIWLP